MLEAEDPPALSPWFRVYPDRFAEERSALEAMGFVFDEKWFAEAEEVIFRGTLSAYPDRNIIITFPFSYPSIAPRVTDDGNCPRSQAIGPTVFTELRRRLGGRGLMLST